METRWPDSRTGVLATWFRIWRSHADGVMRTGTRDSPSWPGLRPQAGYVDADWQDQIAETACRRGGPYVSEAGGYVDGGTISQRHHRADTRHRHRRGTHRRPGFQSYPLEAPERVRQYRSDITVVRCDDNLERVGLGKLRPARIYSGRFQTTLTLSPVATRTVNVSRSPVIEKLRV